MSSLCNFLWFRAVTGMRRDFYDPDVNLCNRTICNAAKLINSCRQRICRDWRVHLCNWAWTGFSISIPLQRSVAIGILWMGFTVLTPVSRITLDPSLLSPLLVVMIIRVSFKFVFSPLPFTLCLATGFWAVSLMRRLGAWLKNLAACFAVTVFHEKLHTQKRE